MTLTERIRRHIETCGTDTNRSMSLALGVDVEQVTNATRKLVDTGELTFELLPRKGTTGPARLFSSPGGMTREASPQMVAAMNDLQRAWM